MNQNKFRSSIKEPAPEIKASLEDFVIPATVYDFPRMEKVPSGYYYTEIIDVQPRLTIKGKKCIDVIYDLQGFHKKLGDHTIKLSYPEGSQALLDLYKAMLKAGIPAGSNMSAAIGVTEKIHLVYDTEDGIGRIHKRVFDPVEEEDYEDNECTEESSGEEDGE